MVATYYILLFISVTCFINGGIAADSDDDDSSGVDTDAPARITRTDTEEGVGSEVELLQSGNKRAVECKDINDRCKKMQKWCKKPQYVKWMKDNCKKTCGYCEGDGDGNGDGGGDDDITSKASMRKCFEAHNKYRANHTNTNKLVWDEGLAKKAQVYANYLVKKQDQQHDANRGKTIGENLAYANWPVSWGKFTCEQALQGWYDEYKNYNFNSGNGRGVFTHFTQMVWTKTKKVGLAMAIDKFGDNRIFYQVVGRYEPKGNWDDFKTHVMKFKSES